MMANNVWVVTCFIKTVVKEANQIGTFRNSHKWKSFSLSNLANLNNFSNKDTNLKHLTNSYKVRVCKIEEPLYSTPPLLRPPYYQEIIATLERRPLVKGRTKCIEFHRSSSRRFLGTLGRIESLRVEWRLREEHLYYH